MEWLFPAVVATLSGSIVLTLTFYYLYYHDRRRFLGIWTLSWGLYALRFVFMLLAIGNDSTPWPMIASQLAALTSGIFLIAGTIDFLGRRIRWFWVLIAMVLVPWIVATGLLDSPFIVSSLPVYLFLGGIYVATGVALLRHLKGSGIGRPIIGWAFILWGIHKADYPFLHPLLWLAPWGYLLGATLEIVVAVGILIVYFQSTRAELAESEDRYHSLFADNHSVMLLIDPETGGVVDANSAACAFYGYGREELLGLKITDINILPPEKVRAEMARARDEERHHFYFQHKLANGAIRDVEVYSGPIQLKGRKYLYSIIHDISERKQAEDALRAEKEFVNALFNGLDDTLFVFDPATGRALRWNPVFQEKSGYGNEEIAALKVPESYYAGEDLAKAADAVREVLAGGKARVELSFLTKDGRAVPFEYSVARVNDPEGGEPKLVAIGRDISERKRAERERELLEERLRQTTKMEAIGTLAGGIAHDFNNILAAIIGYSELITTGAEAESTAREYAGEIFTAGIRAKELVQQILAFSRHGEKELRPVRLQPIIQEALKMLRASLPATIEIVQDISPQCGAVLADPVQIHQVMMNLCTNAFHAMEEGGGQLKIVLSPILLAAGEDSENRGLAPGKYLSLQVADTGTGMDSSIQDRIFDPYFTTKELGKGSGLGLSVVHGIVARCGGRISVASTPGKGATFTVLLPEIEADVPIEYGVETVARGSGQKILVVDDEPQLAMLMKAMVTRLGYTAHAKTSSAAALDLFRSQPDHFDLLLTDQTMPEMTGMVLAGEVLALRPDMPVILCTGFSEKVDASSAKAAGVREFLSKPVQVRELARALDKVFSVPNRKEENR